MAVKGGAAAGSFEFDDFDRFRETIAGWDTDPTQLSSGALRLTHDFLRTDGLTIARIRANQRIADVSAIQPGGITLVLALAAKRCCGVVVEPGSVVVMGSGRDYRNVLSAGWESIEISVTEEFVAELGLFGPGALPRGLPPERCVFPLSGRRVARVRRWASGLLDPPAPSASASLAVRAKEAGETLRACVLPDLLAAPLALAGSRWPERDTRRASDDLVASVLRAVDGSCGARLTVEQLAREIGVSRRTLEHAFLAVFGCAPSRFLRLRRLARVRRDLLHGASVTEAALAHQFVSLGRFSELYRRQFGELPSDTRSQLQPFE